MSGLVSFTKDGDIGVITINNPPVNALSPGVPEGIVSSIQNARQDDSIKAVVLIGGGRTFIAGADIKGFEKIICGKRERGVGLHPLLYQLEDCPKPVVCALHGTALGGGLEVAMACHYRIAVHSALVGQPEVNLGLIPGAGGTQRLPRLAGVAKAVEMCSHGDPLKAAAALQSGIVDAMVEGDLLQGAIRFARDLVARGDGPRKTRDLAGKLGTEEENAAIFSGARDLARKRDRGRIAPLKAIDAIEAATRLPFEAGCAREAELFMECLFSEQSKALIHVFFGEREVSRIPGLRKDAAVMDITAAAVVGGGTMGSGIAMTYANAGIPVILKEASSDASDRAMETIRRTYAGAVQKGRVEPHAAAQRLALIHPSITYDGFGDVDIVVEAVFEDIDLKRQVFAELDRVCRPGAVLATNTSTLDVDRIASATSRPAQVIGHHFFAPPHVMRLLEMVRGRQTSDEVIATTLSLAKKLGKVGVLVGNCRGFVGNRMYHQYQREAQLLVEEGASVEQVDLALYNFGMAMGPLAVADLSGLDVGRRIRNQNPGMEPEGTRRPVVADRLCDTGRLGQKTGAGWYRYEPGERRPIPDPAVAALIEECAREKGITRNSITPDVIVERTIYALINEGARILEEGIALRAVDIDIIYVHGYGFPAHRGGPMWFADTVGISKVYERVSGFQRQFGDTWAPAPLLKDLAATGLSFASLDQGRSTAKH